MSEKMKAHVLYGPDNLKFEEVSVPKPQEGWVLVKVENAGICGSDIARIFTTGAHRHPLIPGHEFSGRVADANGNDDWQGKRVGIFPLIPCMKCDCCRAKKYEMCKAYNYLGSRCDGGFAEYVAVPVRNLLELPESVTFEQAAMLEPMAVAMHAIRQIKPGQSAVVCGLGTIGLLVIMLLKAMGVEAVYAIGRKRGQLEKAGELGAIAFTRNEFIEQGLTADYFFECVGKNETIRDAIDFAAPGGRICLVGNPASDMAFDKDTYWKILRKQLTLKGTWNSSYMSDEVETGDNPDDWHMVIKLIEEGRIHPEKLITHRLKLCDLMHGLLIMRDKTEEYIKIMVESGK